MHGGRRQVKINNFTQASIIEKEGDQNIRNTKLQNKSTRDHKLRNEVNVKNKA